jgi:hypothetical protein
VVWWSAVDFGDLITVWFRNGIFSMGRDSAVGIATRYGLDGPQIESRWGRNFPTRPDRPWGPTSLIYVGYRVSFPGIKRPGRGVDHPFPSSADVKESVELYLCSPSRPSRPVSGWAVPLPLPYTLIGVIWQGLHNRGIGVLFSTEARDLSVRRSIQIRCVAFPFTCLVINEGCLFGTKFGQGVKLTAHLYLLLMRRMNVAISPLLCIWLVFIRVKDGFPSVLTVVSSSCLANFS